MFLAGSEVGGGYEVLYHAGSNAGRRMSPYFACYLLHVGFLSGLFSPESRGDMLAQNVG
jgi:hypothetical protein